MRVALGASVLAAASAMFAAGCAPHSAVAGVTRPGPQASAEAHAVPVPVGNNLLKNSTFEGGSSLPWTASFTQPADGTAGIVKGALCLTVANGGQNPWDAQVRHREMVIQKGHTYAVRFHASASAPTRARMKVGMSGAPYAEYWSTMIDVGTEPREYTGKFTMSNPDDPTAELAFHVGGPMAKAQLPFDVCIDDVHLDDQEFKAVESDTRNISIPNVLVNEVGYLPSAAKIATVKTSAKAPLDWELLDAAGKAVARGKTRVFGADPASGEHVHVLDFSAFRTPGEGYVLQVGADKSFAFDVDDAIYSKLKYDALAYFFQSRSGMAIAKDFVTDAALARPAGHMGDNSVKCLPGSGCDYTLDASGGWYDAGDHGKYVVNGGISLWTLLNQYERAKFLGSSSADFGDGKLRIPEANNKVPDILDEARYELEFLLKMQVPPGKPKAGMVHHKLTDADWTGLGTAPHEDTQPRYLHAPSTAATLNLAATAAQGARIWKSFDTTFSARCLAAASAAWVAAKANPKIYAPKSDDKGGGSYSDDDTSDDFYWAAAELFITTGKPEYRQFLAASPHDKRFRTEAAGHSSSMNWGSTDALGQISLAVVPSTLSAPLVKAIRARIAEAADGYLNVEQAEGYRTPLQRTAQGAYVWGSNSFVLNNLIVIGLAYDFTKAQKYLDGVATGMDYLLGRNPLGQSYVSGYGEKPLENPHHRFWAHQANGRFPRAPAGLVSGGPNSYIDDPYSKAAGLRGCAPEKCYVDNIEAYSVNEIAINWNAPLAWVTAFLDEKAHVPPGT